MTDTPMTPDRLAEYRALIARTTDADALVASPGALRELLAEVDRLRAELARWRERTEEAETSEAQLKGRVRGLRAQVDELEAEREAGPTRDTPDAGTPRLTGLPLGLTGRARHEARVAMETARKTRRRADACDSCGDIPDEWCPDCAACRQGCHGGHDNNPCTHPNAPWNTGATR